MEKSVIVIGSGPNRIGQGIEFDYASVHAIEALKEEGYKAIMINCNPETVSTDYDIASELYFEPIFYENVLNIIKKEKDNLEGVILQFGGQTPLKLAKLLKERGIKVLGTDPDYIDIAEDRELFSNLIASLGIKQPINKTAKNREDAIKMAKEIFFPVLVRPSYVLGGRAMRIVYSEEELLEYLEEAVSVSNEKPILIDKYLEDSIELDVDALCDGKDVLIGAIMEHIEEAGVHSGDSAFSIPPYSLNSDVLLKIIDITKKLSFALNVKGLINIQFALKDDEVYVLEVNPRSSRSVPFVSKAIGYPLAKIATKISIGKALREIVPEVFELKNKSLFSDFVGENFEFFFIKEVVFPWNKFPETDPVLGPEMKSTGEVMGIGKTFGEAFYKAQVAAGNILKEKGTVFVSVANKDKPKVVPLVKEFLDLGFKVVATSGTYNFLKEKGFLVEKVLKVKEGRPNIIDKILNNEIDLIINTPSGNKERSDASIIRKSAVIHKIPYVTTLRGSFAALEAIKFLRENKEFFIISLQEVYERCKSDNRA